MYQYFWISINGVIYILINVLKYGNYCQSSISYPVRVFLISSTNTDTFYSDETPSLTPIKIIISKMLLGETLKLLKNAYVLRCSPMQ